MLDVAGMYNEFRLVGMSSMCNYEYIPKRRHKRKRIQKKWNRRYGLIVKEIPWNTVNVFIPEKTIFGHPEMIKKLAKSANEVI